MEVGIRRKLQNLDLANANNGTRSGKLERGIVVAKSLHRFGNDVLTIRWGEAENECFRVKSSSKLRVGDAVAFSILLGSNGPIISGLKRTWAPITMSKS